VAAIAKRDLPAGHRIARGMGSFDVRGQVVESGAAPGHLPIGAMRDVVLTRDVNVGELLAWRDVETPDTFPLRVCRQLFA